MYSDNLNNETQGALELIKNSNKILVTYFSSTDGDSLGAALAVYSLLKKLDKDVTCFVHDNVPESYNFLPNLNELTSSLDNKGSLVISLKCADGKIDGIKYLIDGDKVNIHVTPKNGQKIIPENISFIDSSVDSYDLIISVDSGEKEQMKETYEKYKSIFDNTPLINIDHHSSNKMYGSINLVDTSAASTTQVLLRMLKSDPEFYKLIDEDIATFMLLGLIFDTGSFQHANTTPEALDTAAELVELGARQQDIIRNLFKTKKMGQLKLWGEILSRVEHDKENRITWSYVKRTDYDSTGSNSDDVADIIDDLLSNAPNTDFVILFKEKDDGTVRVSTRSTNDQSDCTKICQAFGGGGHVRAAGCGLNGPLDEAMNAVLDKAREIQRGR